MQPTSPNATSLVSAIQIAIIDSEELTREGLVCLLERVADFKVVASVRSALELKEQLPIRDPDAIVFSLAQRGPFAFELVSELQSQFPSAKLILFDEAPRLFRLAQLLRFQPAGYFTKSDSVTEVVDAIRAVVCNECRFSKAVSDWIEHKPDGWHVRKCYLAGSILHLTDRELQVLRCLAEGQSVKRCAERLNISPSTVDNHRARIFKKLGVSKTIDMLRVAMHQGVLPR